MANFNDFRVKHGLVVATTATIQSTALSASTTTGALQVFGGVGIGGGIFVGGTVTATTFVGNVTGNVTGNLTGTASLATTATNIAGGTAGSIPIQVSPGVTSFVPLGTSGFVLTAGTNTATWTAVSGLSAGTATNANNVLTSQQISAGTYYPVFVSANNATGAYMPEYTTSTFQVNPGSGLVTVGSLSVGTAGATFNGPVTFNGSATYILTTNTFYTDNLIELHTPPAGVSALWTVDDGKDVGLRFHYYANSTDTNAALVLDATSKELHWYSSGAESTGGDFSTATYGTFRTANIIANGTSSAVSTTTGALQVVGGAGIGGGLYVGGSITATNIVRVGVTSNALYLSQGIVGSPGGNLNLQAGGAVQSLTHGGIQFNNNGGTSIWGGTSSISTGTNAGLWLAGGYGEVYVSKASVSNSTNSGAFQVVGGAGIGGNLYVGSPLVLTTATNWDTNKRFVSVGAISSLYHDSGASTYLAHNYFQNGSTSTYITTGTAGYYAMSGNLHAWGIAASGTPGTPVTFTQAVTLQTDGSFNIGYTTAQQGARLSVNGGGYFNGTVTATNFILNGYQVSTATSGAASTTIVTQATLTNASFFPTFVDANNASATGELIYTTSTFSINPNTGIMTAKNIRTTADTLALGLGAGNSSQGANAIAIGLYAGATQGSGAIAIGWDASTGGTQNGDSIAIGHAAGRQGLGQSAVAIGYNAGYVGLGQNTVAIGSWAGYSSTVINAIFLNGTGSALEGTNSGLYIAPIRSDVSTSATTYAVYYNPTTREVTTSTIVSSGTGSSGTGTTSTFVISNTTSATSTTTGALQVAGGAGIRGDVYVGGAIYTGGNRILPTSIQEFIATAGQTTFTISGGYVVGQVQVYANGVQLSSADYTASNGTTVVVVDARRVSDVIRVVVGQNNSVSLQQAYTFNQYTSNGTTTTFATSYNTATVQVYQNGTLQMPTTYTANNSTSIIFGSIPTNGTVIGVISFNSVSIANAISSSGGTINGTLNVVGNLQVNGNNIQNYATAMSVAMGI